MLKRSLLLCVLICFNSTSLFSQNTEPENLEEESMHMGHDYYRKKAIQRAQDSKKALQKRYDAVIKQLKENPPTGEEDHDEYIMDAVQQNQKDWLNYRYSYCQTKTLLEIYPSRSKLFVQVLNSCIGELNKERIKYYDNLLLELKNR